jgi:hypothetical protein
MTNLQRERVVITPEGGEGVQGCERNLGWGPQNTRGQLFLEGGDRIEHSALDVFVKDGRSASKQRRT